MKHQHVAALVEPVQGSQRRMQPKRAVEIEYAARVAGTRQGEAAPRRAIVGVAMGRHRGKTVQGAAQDHHEQPLVGGGLPHLGERQSGPSGGAKRQGARPFESLSAREHPYLR